MIPVYYFDKIPEKLPDDDACYIVSKYIYLKKRSGLIDSMVRVESINMGEVLPEFARMKLPKIKAATFGKVVGFFKMVYGHHKSESGVILNLKTHPNKPELKKIDYTIPNQDVSGGRCKYAIVVDSSYINCGTIHCHSDFGAFHSGTDVDDERYFDGLHITVGHINQKEVSISACIVVNGKRVKVDPCDYIEGITESKESRPFSETQFYVTIDPSMIMSNESDMKYVSLLYQTSMSKGYKPLDRFPQRQTKFDWDNWFDMGHDIQKVKTTCDECVFKEEKITNLLDDVVFDDDTEDASLFADEPYDPYKDVISDDMTFTERDRMFFEKDSAPLFEVGETDEDEIVRQNNYITMADYREAKKHQLNKAYKCTCGSSFYVTDPEKNNPCPKCEKVWPARKYSMTQFLKDRREVEKNLA